MSLPAAAGVHLHPHLHCPPGGSGPSGPLWYNGDFDGVNGLANERDTSLGSGQYASVYDDFIVPAGSGWDVTSVFSDNLANTNITGATWEIRQGISEGNGGTLIASGTTVTPVVTPTGRSGFGFTEFMVEVTGLSVHLPPGTYWLNVTVTGDLSGRSFDSTTVGANCVGTPCGNNQNAFFDSNFFGVDLWAHRRSGPAHGLLHGREWHCRAAAGTPTPTPTPTATPTCPPGGSGPSGPLWYNGDFDGVNGLANERDTSLGSGQYASVYDDFIVPAGSGWACDIGLLRQSGEYQHYRRDLGNSAGHLRRQRRHVDSQRHDSNAGSYSYWAERVRIYRIHGRGYRTERSFAARHLLAQCDGDRRPLGPFV